MPKKENKYKKGFDALYEMNFEPISFSAPPTNDVSILGDLLKQMYSAEYLEKQLMFANQFFTVKDRKPTTDYFKFAYDKR